MSASETFMRWRYRLVPDHVVGEILSKNWIDNAIPMIFLGFAVALLVSRFVKVILSSRESKPRSPML